MHSLVSPYYAWILGRQIMLMPSVDTQAIRIPEFLLPFPTLYPNRLLLCS